MTLLQRIRRKLFLKAFMFTSEIIISPIIIVLTAAMRFKSKPIDIGLGPEPMINNIYHKKALALYNIKAETFTHSTYFITNDFDFIANNTFKGVFQALIPYWLYFRTLARYKAIYIYATGGPLSWTYFHKHLEPFLYKLASIKVVVMPYGGDVHELLRSDNLLFRNAITKDYPQFQKERRKIIIKNIDKWTKHADHIISGCDWVYYMYHWDTLMLAHFSIDTETLKPDPKPTTTGSIKILHAPNHKNVKGSKFFIKAIKQLKQEGYDIELILVQCLPNNKIKQLMQKADIIADQLIIGWYAMTAIEGMCLEKPVLCYLNPKLIELFEAEGLISGEEEIPLVNCNFRNVKEKIKYLLDNPDKRIEIGKAGRKFVEKHHSLKAIGAVFERINISIGINKR